MCAERFTACSKPPMFQETVHVDVGEQWACDAALRRAAGVAPTTPSPCRIAAWRHPGTLCAGVPLAESYSEPYGPAFQYQEYLKHDPPLAQAKAIVITAVMKGFTAGMKHAVGRRLLLPFLPGPGEGPSETTMANGWMRCEVIGRTD
jgi:hypothetical protein